MDWFQSIINDFFQWLCNLLMDSVLKIYESVTDITFSIKTTTGSGTTLLPGINVLGTICDTLAWLVFSCLVYLLFVKPLIESLGGTNNVRTSPGIIFQKIVITAIMIISIKLILNVAFEGIDSVRKAIVDAFSTELGTNGNSITWADGDSWGNNLISLAFAGILAYNVFTAAINQVERYIMVYIFYFISPVAMAFNASSENSDVPKNFIISLISQMVAILMNTFLFYIFRMKLASGMSGLQDWVIAIGIMAIAKNSEQILNALGFHSLPSPNAARDFFTGAMAAGRAVSTGAKAIKATSHVAGAVATTAGNRYNPKNGSPNMLKNTAGKGNTPLKSMTSQDLAKKAQKDNLSLVKDPKTGQYKQVGSFDANDNKQIAKETGATQTRKSGGIVGSTVGAIKNRAGFKSTANATNDAVNEGIDATNKLNAYKQGSSAVLSNKDAATAMNLSTRMPGFTPASGQAVRKASNGDMLMDGTMTTQNRDGTSTTSPVTMAFSDSKWNKDTNSFEDSRGGTVDSGYKYSKEGYDIASDGSMTAHSITSAANTSSLENSYDAQKIPNTQLNDILKPSESMNGMSVNGDGYMTDEGNMFFRGTTENPDGSFSEKTYMVSQNPVTNGDVNDGYQATERRYDLGNDTYAVEVHRSRAEQGKEPEYKEVDDNIGVHDVDDDYSSFEEHHKQSEAVREAQDAEFNKQYKEPIYDENNPDGLPETNRDDF